MSRFTDDAESLKKALMTISVGSLTVPASIAHLKANCGWLWKVTQLTRPTVSVAFRSCFAEVISQTKSAHEEEFTGHAARESECGDEGDQEALNDPLTWPTPRERRLSHLILVALHLTTEKLPTDVRGGIAEDLLVWDLVQQWLSAETIFGCERIFCFLESWFSQGSFEHIVATSMMNRLALVRLCNSVVKRLSATNNTAFAGKIMMMLCHSLPVDEKSGLNLMGTFHTANTTILETGTEDVETSIPATSTTVQDAKAAQLNEDQKAMATLLSATGSAFEAVGKPGEAGAVDMAFYGKFWKIQSYLSNPGLLLEGSNAEQFNEALKAILQVFSVTGAVEESSSSPSSSSASSLSSLSDEPPRKKHKSSTTSDRHLSHPGVASSSSTRSSTSSSTSESSSTPIAKGNVQMPYFPKYLTAPSLLPLQLSDKELRRSLLAQIVMVLYPFAAPVYVRNASFSSSSSTSTPSSSSSSSSASGRKSHGALVNPMNPLNVPGSDMNRPRPLSDDRHLPAIRRNAPVFCAIIDRCLQYMSKHSTEDAAFANDLFELVSARETLWRVWKSAQCPPISIGAGTDLAKPITPASSTKGKDTPLAYIRDMPDTSAFASTSTSLSSIYARVSDGLLLRVFGKDTPLPLPSPPAAVAIEPLYKRKIDQFNSRLDSAMSASPAAEVGDMQFTSESRLPMGTLDLARMWLTQSSVHEYVFGGSKAKFPTERVRLQHYMDTASSDQHKATDPIFAWRGLRAAMAEDYELFIKAMGSLTKAVNARKAATKVDTEAAQKAKEAASATTTNTESGLPSSGSNEASSASSNDSNTSISKNSGTDPSDGMKDTVETSTSGDVTGEHMHVGEMDNENKRGDKADVEDDEGNNAMLGHKRLRDEDGPGDEREDGQELTPVQAREGGDEDKMVDADEDALVGVEGQGEAEVEAETVVEADAVEGGAEEGGAVDGSEEQVNVCDGEESVLARDEEGIV